MNEPLISVIIPIFKVESYLPKCIESIISQTYKNLEINLVDDGSPDRCPEICEEYARKDSRIKVFHKVNGGLSDARNYGIRNSTGDYIGFVDSDDFIHETFYEKLMVMINEYDADISICDMLRFKDYKDILTDDLVCHNDVALTNTEALKALFTAKDYGSVMACNKLYKACLFKDHDIYFPIGCIHEDNYTTYKLFYYSDKIVYTNDKLYYYLQRSTSIMGNSDIKKRMDGLAAAEEAVCFIDSNLPELKNEVRTNYVLSNMTILNYMIEHKVNDKKLKKQLMDNIVNECGNENVLTLLPMKHQYGIFLLRKSLFFYSVFIYIYLKKKIKNAKID